MRYKSQAARTMGFNKKRADEGEERAKAKLRSLGVLMVEGIGTPFVITATRPDGWVRGYYKERVSGDIIGHTENGIKVLAEVKTVLDRNLRWSDFKEHQPRKLSENAEKAISLLIWLHSTGMYAMYWQDVLSMGFRPGKGLTEKQAEKISIERL